jgi:hypothetical protein
MEGKSKKRKKSELYTHKKKGIFARITARIIKTYVGKMDYFYQFERPEEPSLLVGNHTKFYAPLAIQYTYPEDVRTWSASNLLNVKEAKQLFRNRILPNIKGERFFRMLVPFGVPLIVLYYRRHLNPVPVYRDFNISLTFEKSIKTLQNGSHIVIYPEERDEKYNDYICAFRKGFVYLAQNYYEATGKRLKFFPFYCAQSIHQTHFGRPIEYDPDIPIKIQAAQIAHYLEEEITRIIDSLPPHKVISMMGDIFDQEKLYGETKEQG